MTPPRKRFVWLELRRFFFFFGSVERIRNTLSHEMCHLACWIINQDPKEGHGKVWKSWWVTCAAAWG